MKPIVPFEPVVTESVPIGDNWVAQVKWDGTRILTYHDDDNTKLYNRKLNERTKQYPELLHTSTYLEADSFILDGEIIALKDGKPSFYEVMKRDRLKNIDRNGGMMDRVPITYMVFDILYLNGNWVTDKPLAERMELLKALVKPNEHVQLVESFRDKEGLLQACLSNDLEGVVFKDLTSTYTIGAKDKRWLKRKKQHDLIAVIGGVTYKKGVANSLHLGLYDQETNLIYIGSVGNGKLTNKDWVELTKILVTLQMENCPFINISDGKSVMVWLKPILTVKVSFLEWIEDQTLRHPIIEAFVTTDPLECRLEKEE
ncbi:ATP-dependent DNA ligase [Niallia taxi]|uniref:ATP-dependent DNA ligase n=1 Tax=Niallia taxi TaxID=2499688 RepID=UPI0011A750E6